MSTVEKVTEDKSGEVPVGETRCEDSDSDDDSDGEQAGVSSSLMSTGEDEDEDSLDFRLV